MRATPTNPSSTPPPEFPEAMRKIEKAIPNRQKTAVKRL
jgi:hypothetical protein